MPFTDEDMNRWKGVTTSCENRGSIVCDDYSRINHRTLIALLARLEAAEMVVHRLEASKDLRDFDWFIPTCKEYDAWRKASGKEPKS